MEHNRVGNFYKNSLDYIGIFAALQVMVAHTSAYIIGNGSGAGVPFWRVIAPGPAVVVFFVISGFLTTASFERSHGLSEFYVKRMFRVYPALILAIIIPGLVYSIFNLVEIDYIRAIPFYIKKILTGRGHDIVPSGALGNGSLWTIFIQIQFYILTPLLYKIISAIKPVYKGILLFVLILINICHPLIVNVVNGSGLQRLYADTCLPYLYMYVIGMVIYIERNSLIPILSNKKILAIEISLYVIWHWIIGADFLCKWTYINPISAILIGLIAIGLGYALGDRHCKYDISFGVFLWHLPVTDMIHHVIGQDYSIGMLIEVWCISVLVALLSNKFVEAPMIKMGRKICRKLKS